LVWHGVAWYGWVRYDKITYRFFLKKDIFTEVILRQHELILVFCKKTPHYYPQKTEGHKPVHNFTKHTSDGTNYGQTELGIKGGGQTDRYPSTILEVKTVNNDAKDRIHPVQKPVELFEYLIKTYSQPGDIVLDNAIGSGTTAVAAKFLNRQFVGIEKEEEYWLHANARLEGGKGNE
jgi:DNA modification methylase